MTSTQERAERPRELEEEIAQSEENATQPRTLAVVYDELDFRLMDTFPASDAIARY